MNVERMTMFGKTKALNFAGLGQTGIPRGVTLRTMRYLEALKLCLFIFQNLSSVNL